MFYAGYGEVDDDSLREVAAPCGGRGSGGDAGMFEVEEGVDCLTLLHHDLNICTNSVSYCLLFSDKGWGNIQLQLNCLILLSNGNAVN